MRKTSCPTDIARLVIAVVVYAIKCHTNRTFANVSKKGDKVMPAVANFDAASAVVFVFWCIWIAASLFHPAPSAVQWMAFIACVSVAKLSTPFSATASFCVAGSKTVANYDAGLAAIALAKPYFVFSLIAANRLNGYKFAKAQSGNILESTHDGLLERLLWQVAGWRGQRHLVAHSITDFRRAK